MMASTGTFVAVVDKAEKERVVWKAEPEGEGHVPERFRAMLRRLDADQMTQQVATLHYGVCREKGSKAAIASLSWGQELAPAVREIWQEIAALDTADDLALALWTLDHNASADARRAAVVVLGNFLQHDAAWWAIADALRDPVERVRGAATTAFHSALEQTPRKVDWQPATTPVSHVLNGTNLMAVHVLAKALVATEVEPALARPLTERGAHALLDYAGADAAFAHEPARRLLARLTKGNHGRDRAAWMAEVAKLR